MLNELSTLGQSVSELVSTTPVPETRNVSNSEAIAFLSCKRMYNFAFIDNLEPLETARPLARGTMGHLAFEYYIRARLNGDTHEQSMAQSMQAFASIPQGTPIDAVMHAQFLYQRYMEYHQGWPEWRLLGTEERLDLKISETLNMPIRYDLYVEHIPTGKRLIGDFKFTYDFWTPDDHDTNPQMPKYIAVMRANGLQVDGGFLEEIRTRNLGKEKASDPKNLWRRTTYNPSLARIRTMLRQHVAVSHQIEEHRALPPEDRDIPLFSKHGACKFCNFKDLCNSMTEGKTDLGVDIRVGYKQNTYGYNKTAMEEII